MRVNLNNQPYDTDGTTLTDLLRELGQDVLQGIAVAVNQEVVARGQWPNRVLNENDHILIITATQGG